MSELTKEQMQQDIDFLLIRSMQAGCMNFTKDRNTGLSSNSLVRLAYSPHSVPEMPFDASDLKACKLTFKSLPEHRKTDDVKKWYKKQQESVT